MLYRDIAERAAWTFVQAFLAVFIPALIAGATVDSLKAAAFAAGTAGIAAALSVIKGVAASFVGDPTEARF